MAAFGQGQEIIGDHEMGKDLYEQYCLNCHGKDGDGQGPDTKFRYCHLNVDPTLNTRFAGT